MESSVFESLEKTPKEKKINISIPIELDQLINSINDELKIKAPNFHFNTTSICVAALSKAAKKAKRELENMGSSQSLPKTIVPPAKEFTE